MIIRALLNAPFFIPKDADLLRNRKVNTKKRQNRHLPELAFLILGTYFTAPFCLPAYPPHIVGLILCKNENRLVAEYALKDMTKPMSMNLRSDQTCDKKRL